MQVTRLCDLSPDSNTVTSVSWNERGNTVAVGTHHGYVTVWDVAANKQVSNGRQTRGVGKWRMATDPLTNRERVTSNK